MRPQYAAGPPPNLGPTQHQSPAGSQMLSPARNPIPSGPHGSPSQPPLDPRRATSQASGDPRPGPSQAPGDPRRGLSQAPADPRRGLPQAPGDPRGHHFRLSVDPRGGPSIQLPGDPRGHPSQGWNEPDDTWHHPQRGNDGTLSQKMC